MSIAVPVKAAESNLEDLLKQLRLGETITLIGSEGKPVALLVSLESTKNGPKPMPASDWEARLDILAQKVSLAWKSEKSAVETLSEMRR
jgi:antitoxin (DNA-binding transcriptional repressor) of toxin-antitoxin stability system